MLITGGSGTFGSAFIRHALEAGANRVICLSRGEHRQNELKRTIQHKRLECWVGDVRDRDRLHWAFRVKPDVLIHAAAIKTIEACEHDPAEAVKTNVDGTRNVVEEAMLSGIPRVVVVSSDKATEPVTTYGKTKAAAEAIAIGQNAYRGTGPTRISVVRYGNVEASQGSIAPLFTALGEIGAPIPITHPEMTRFWWRVEDAVAFVAKILHVMRGGEIFIPKIKSHRIVDLARHYAPHSEQQIVGVRSIEKIHELMISADEAAMAWECPEYYVLTHGTPPIDGVPVPAGFRLSSGDDPVPVCA